MRVGIQPYTLNAVDEPLAEKLDRIARAGFEGVELGPEANTDAVHERLAAHGLTVSSVATGLDDLDDSLDAHVAAAEDYHTDDVGVMWIDPEEFESYEGVERAAERLSTWADRLADHGLQLHYHNHAHEFTDLGDETAYEALVGATDRVNFEVDLGWAGTAGADPAALLRRLDDRVSHVHFKDMDFRTGEFVTFGEGDLDVPAVVDAAREVGVEWLLFENDEPTDPKAEPGHASVVLDQYTDHYC